jgi:hypothetical protein
MKYLILLFLLIGCGGGDGGSPAGGSAPKQFFSLWVLDGTAATLDLRDGGFAENLTLSNVPIDIDQAWIDSLNTAGRDTTGLSAGDVFTCGYDLYVVGDNSSGGFALNHADIDTPTHNACLSLDSNCSTGVCNISADHKYTITNNVMTINWFGGANLTSYPKLNFK